MKRLTPEQYKLRHKLDIARSMLVMNGLLSRRDNQKIKRRLKQLFEDKEPQLCQLTVWKDSGRRSRSQSPTSKSPASNGLMT